MGMDPARVFICYWMYPEEVKSGCRYSVEKKVIVYTFKWTFIASNISQDIENMALPSGLEPW